VQIADSFWSVSRAKADCGASIAAQSTRPEPIVNEEPLMREMCARKAFRKMNVANFVVIFQVASEKWWALTGSNR
jgi:hypothetical protein